uniref:Multifunctional fusion protein n=1 Tax=uncultured Gemmatimonadales bacterium HF0770_41L09 TaxID=723617 RepID=E7C7X0_9BACT|nr:UDP-3-O-acyl-N-acetylglucosamine deacetylase [uncultured Gemmatimonadales bacterium HF0770_41L09]
MTEPSQRTIRKDVSLAGTGVHSGESATITLRPGNVNTGIRFRRVDLDGCPEIPATLSHVVGTELGTSLANGDAQVNTVEHVMAALAAAQVDNAIIDLDGQEVPIRDGSFQDYVHALRDVGIKSQEVKAKVVRVKTKVTTTGGDGQSYSATMNRGLTIVASIDFEHSAIGRQSGEFSIDLESFETELASARTFGFKKDEEELHDRGLALGASLDNTVVLGQDGVMGGELRFPNEFLRHKVGDLIGDLALLGARIEARIVAERPSHAGNIELAKALQTHARDTNREAIVDTAKIMQYLPHRYPMLLVDRITEYEAGKRIVGIKNVTINEPFFQGHYPGHPVMPGVLIIEAMAQVGGLLLMEEVEKHEDKVVYFMSLDRVKWRKPVTPGDTIVFELELLQFRRQVCKLKGQGFVEGTLVAEAEMMATIVDK